MKNKMSDLIKLLDKNIYKLKKLSELNLSGNNFLPINIVFDGPPSNESGRFVEVETDDGKGIKVGEWIERKDGLWALRITSLPKNDQGE